MGVLAADIGNGLTIIIERKVVKNPQIIIYFRGGRFSEVFLEILSLFFNIEFYKAVYFSI